MSSNFNLSCVLFDLDGTLVDTAPDLIACLNTALKIHGFKQVLSRDIKPYISYGAAVMINQSITTNDITQHKILNTMLSLYQDNIAKQSRFFSGIPETLKLIESLGLKWGVVTNKKARFTDPLMDAFKLTHRAACIISGDTTAHSKPHPEPMLTACRLAEVKPEECVYIGDAIHDIQAGKNTNMKTIAALYGYLKPEDTPLTWDADVLIENPKQLTSWITATCH